MNNKILISDSFFGKTNWQYKRIGLNLIWGLINITVLVYITTQIMGTGWKFIWFGLALIYALLYWILATMIFDAIIGDEVDNNYG